MKGVYKIVNYFAVHGKYDFYNNDLLYGIIALIFGILSVVLWEKPSSKPKILPFGGVFQGNCPRKLLLNRIKMSHKDCVINN